MPGSQSRSRKSSSGPHFEGLDDDCVEEITIFVRLFADLRPRLPICGQITQTPACRQAMSNAVCLGDIGDFGGFSG